jgi:rhodanese-related sulfurtransferase
MMKMIKSFIVGAHSSIVRAKDFIVRAKDFIVRAKDFSPLLVTLILCVVFGLAVPQMALASQSADSVDVSVEVSVDISEAIDEFLTTIPADYYKAGDTQALKEVISRDNPLIVDVREPSEYAAGHIPHAINIPLRSLSQNLNQIPKNRPVILYCSSGYRTAIGLTSLQLLGYDNVKSFPPSLAGWKAAGETVER